MDIEKKINDLANVYLEGLNLSDLRPNNITNDESITIIPLENDSAFNLNAPIYGAVKDIKSITHIDNAALVRVIFGYAMASRCVANPKIFPFYFSCLLNSALATATKHCGDLTFREITVWSPGDMSKVFRDREDSASFEMRLYVKERIRV